MRNARTVWLAAIWFLGLGIAVEAAARAKTTTPLEVTYYYLPG